ncbi:hypothetical protein Tco_0815929 [Tanacetum coccineum]
MSTQQDIYAVGSENRPPMLNKENYIPLSSRLLHYAKSRPNGKLIYNSIMNGPYVRRMILEPADGQAIQTILLGLPKDIYAAVDSCETAQEIWLRVQRMMKGSDIGIQEKKAKLFNEWERFTSIDGESIESYYHRFSKLMNDFKRKKYFPKKIASNLKFLNNLQPKWSRHVTIVHLTKDLHTADYTQLYDFLKYNQKEVDELRAERLAKTQDPLALMANSNNSFKYPVFHHDLPSSSTYIQQPLPINNNYNPQLSLNQNYMQQPMPNLKDITDPTATMNTTLALMAKAFKLNYSTPTNNNQRISSNPRNRQIAQPAHQNGNGNVVASQAEGNANGNNANLDKIKKVNANCILMANLQQASTSGTQTDKAPVYDSDGSAEVRILQKSQENGQSRTNTDTGTELSVQEPGECYQRSTKVVQKAVQNPGVQNVGNQNGVIVVLGIAHQNGNGNVVASQAEGNANGNNGNQIRSEINWQAEEFDLMAAEADLDEIEEVNANCILMANLQQASTSGTQTDKALVYDSDGSAKVRILQKSQENGQNRTNNGHRKGIECARAGRMLSKRFMGASTNLQGLEASPDGYK